MKEKNVSGKPKLFDKKDSLSIDACLNEVYKINNNIDDCFFDAPVRTWKLKAELSKLVNYLHILEKKGFYEKLIDVPSQKIIEQVSLSYFKYFMIVANDLQSKYLSSIKNNIRSYKD